MSTVLLFDIDGTLVSTGGAGRRAMIGAFAELGAPGALDGVSFAGMTDRAIARAGLRALTAEVTESAIDRVLDAYLARLEAELGRSEGREATDDGPRGAAEDGARYRVLPGVPALLASVRDLPGVAVGLGTGNVRRGAYAKLARGALDAAFAFGGFGCDAEDRVELLRAGARRGAERLGAPLEACRVIVIGDTPKDVAAARGIGARSVGVGTGGYAPADLAACGAHHVFATLAEDGVRGALLDDG